jgi:hypothetical protein
MTDRALHGALMETGLLVCIRRMYLIKVRAPSLPHLISSPAPLAAHSRTHAQSPSSLPPDPSSSPFHTSPQSMHQASGNAASDPFRTVVLDLLEEKETFKRAEVMEAAQLRVSREGVT